MALQVEVLGRIARQAELGEEDEVCAPSRGRAAIQSVISGRCPPGRRRSGSPARAQIAPFRVPHVEQYGPKHGVAGAGVTPRFEAAGIALTSRLDRTQSPESAGRLDRRLRSRPDRGPVAPGQPLSGSRQRPCWACPRAPRPRLSRPQPSPRRAMTAPPRSRQGRAAARQAAVDPIRVPPPRATRRSRSASSRCVPGSRAPTGAPPRACSRGPRTRTTRSGTATRPQEAAPLCSANFCVHYVDHAGDAPRPRRCRAGERGARLRRGDLGRGETSFGVENGALGWPARSPTATSAVATPGWSTSTSSTSATTGCSATPRRTRRRPALRARVLRLPRPRQRLLALRVQLPGPGDPAAR